MNGDQLYIALVCASLGIAGGALYDFFYCLRVFFRMKWVRFFGDLCFCLLFGAGYLFVSVMLGFPDLRLYCVLACACGFFLYEKSLHKIVAFFAEKVYNGLKRMRKERGTWKKRKLRRKKQSGSP